MILVFLFILGLLVGSFANVLIDRLPRGESVLWGRSHCDHCKKTLRWHELIPVISFLFQWGRCRRCKKKLSPQYPLIELMTGTGFVLLYSVAVPLPALVGLYILFLSLLVIFVADLKFQIIPDSMLVVAAVATTLYLWGMQLSVREISFHALTALVSFGIFYLLWLTTRGKGMGFGDVKFAPVMGLLLGFPGAVIAFYIAFLTGAFVGVILILGRNKSWKSKIAFGPFLVLGTVAAWVWQPQFLVLWRIFI